jgi:hypothetical protein
MKHLKRFNESDQTQPKITEDMIEDIKDIFFNCFSDEFDDHFFEWWSNDLEELDDDKFYIEITQKYWTIDLIVNSVYDNDPFSDFSFTKGLLDKFNRFKKILKDEYNLNFSDNIDWDSTAALPGTYQEFFYTTYTIL